MSEDIEPDEDRMEAQRRRWQLMEQLDREIARKAQAEPVASPAAKPVEIPPVIPQMARRIGRHSPEVQDEWSNRMAAKYGGEW